MNKLPHELWWVIFALLPPKHKIKLRLTCTQFNLIIFPQIYNHYRNSLFIKAAETGDINTLNIIYNHFASNPSTQNEMMKFDKFYSFRIASRNGHLIIIKQLYNWCAEENRVEMAAAPTYNSSHGAFRWASQNGHLAVIQQLYDWSSDSERASMISAEHYGAFRWASQNGQLGIIRKLYEWCKRERSAMITSLDFWGYNGAYTNGYRKVCKQIYSWCSDEQKAKLIKKFY